MTDEQFVIVKESLARLEANMTALVGNGQPGRITKVEADVEDLKSSNNKRIGFTSAFAFIVTGWEVVKHFWKIT